MKLALQFCELALSAAAHLPATERADLYSFAATTLTHVGNHDAAEAADAAANALREAEAAQLTFKRLLSTPTA
jgi:hypothetical protein